jgi:O-antigen/teichoic acid export membrane protein
MDKTSSGGSGSVEAGDDDEVMTQDEAVQDILKGAGVIYGGLVLNLVIAFVAQRFAAVYLSVDGFGSLLSGTALLNVGGILAGLGLSSGLIRYLPRVDAENKRSLVKYSLLITLPVSIALSTTTVVFADPIATQIFNDPQIAVSLRIFGAAIPFAVALEIAVGGIRGQMIPHLRVLVQDILQPVLRFGLIIFAVVVAAGQAGFAAGYAVPYVIASTIAIILLWRALPAGANDLQNTMILREMIEYSLPFTITGLASFVYNSIDVFLILYFLDSRAVGIYGVAYAFARLVSMFSTAFSYLSTPISSQLENNDEIDKAVDTQTVIVRWVLIATMAIAVPMVAFSSELLGLIYRPAYKTGGAVLVILVVGFVSKNILQVHKPILHALGKSKLSAVNTATTAIFNIILNIILIPRYGIEGAAVATTGSFLVLGLLPTVEVWYYTRSVSMSRDLFRSAVVSAVVGVSFVPIFDSTPETILWVLIVSGSFAISYVLCLVVIVGFNREDVMVIRMATNKYDVSSDLLDSLLHRFQK